MLREDEVENRRISASVQAHLMARGIRPPCHVHVVTHHGDVTLSGELQYEHQRGLAMSVAKGVEHVRRVIDNMRVLPRVDMWKTPPNQAHPHDAQTPAPNAAPDATPRPHVHGPHFMPQERDPTLPI